MVFLSHIILPVVLSRSRRLPTKQLAAGRLHFETGADDKSTPRFLVLFGVHLIDGAAGTVQFGVMMIVGPTPNTRSYVKGGRIHVRQ